MAEDSKKGLGFLSVWSLTAGGMVGGGIYTALGVIVAIALQWSWLSFLLAGIIAITSAYSYVKLATSYNESGGAFTYLREINLTGLAGSLSWVLIIGYLLTIALYAFAFGHYISFAFDKGPWLTRILAIGIVAALVGLNLLGVGKMAAVEIIIVLSNLVALISLAIYGLAHWDTIQLVAGAEARPWWSAPIGAAATFVSYEGFQLLTYDYDEIEKPEKILSPAVLSGVACVIVIYIIVALGAVVLAGAITTIDEKQVALAVAAKESLGVYGMWSIVAAAGFATAAAINSTLFSTAKLAKRVASDGELPQFFEHTNSNDIPNRAIILIGALAALLAITGSLSTLVEAASVVFLFTFGTVNFIAQKHLDTHDWIPWTGIILGSIVMVLLLLRLAFTALIPLSVLAFFVLAIVFGRPYILKKVKTDDGNDNVEGQES